MTGAARRGDGRRRLVIVGAGPGGICMAIKLKAAGIDDFVILERGTGAGGTWCNNRYPGLSCDVPSLVYSWTFEQKHDWSRTFAGQPEIERYMQHCVEKYEVGPHIRFGAEVVAAAWSEDAALWTIRTAAGDAWRAEVLIGAVGMFNALRRPDIDGLDEFAGDTIHTGEWSEAVDVTGRRVGVIGSAASATQLVPAIADAVSQLTVFQRTANWVFPKEDVVLSEPELQARRDDPSIGLGLRKETVDYFELLLTWDRRDLMEELEEKCLAALQEIDDPAVRAKLRPRLPFGSQRPLFSDDFYTTFNNANVALVTEPIDRISPAGVRTIDGQEHQLDLLVLATGYIANRFLSIIDVTGREGVSLADVWKDGPQAYMGMSVAGFPNLFMLYGPNTNTGSILWMLELQVAYIVDKLRYMDDHDARWIEVRREAMDGFNQELQRWIAAVDVWQTQGSKYYRADSGRLVTQWPLNMAAFEARTTAEDIDAFDICRSALPASEPIA
jgi:cyclohexanone monooxygenase